MKNMKCVIQAMKNWNDPSYVVESPNRLNIRFGVCHVERGKWQSILMAIWWAKSNEGWMWEGYHFLQAHQYNTKLCFADVLVEIQLRFFTWCQSLHTIASCTWFWCTYWCMQRYVWHRKSNMLEVLNLISKSRHSGAIILLAARQQGGKLGG